MANYDVELEEYKGKLTSQINSIQKILNLNTDGLLEDEIKEKLIDIKSRAQKLKNKLEKNEFEISIVGLEKSGKSSFANALMGCDILPSKEARCTYTSTSTSFDN
ncbi:MAG: dynamin family protein [Lachnospiraceae bacterium]|nr:dynamin family protein [Lachnospiraceae bacterium]